MKRRLSLLAWIASTWGAAAAACGACSETESPSRGVAQDGGPPPDASADGDGPLPPPDAGDADPEPSGEAPHWVDVQSPVPNCPLQRLDNAARVRAFSWEPCADQPNCEQIVRADWLDGIQGFFHANWAKALEPGVHVLLSVYWPPDILVLVGREDGWLVDGYRVQGPTQSCVFIGRPMWGKRYALMLMDLPTAGPEVIGGLVHEIGAAGEPNFFTADFGDAGSCSPPITAMGESRWVWWCAIAQRLGSVSAADGSDYKLYAKAVEGGPILSVHDPASAGDLFFHDQAEIIGDWRTGYAQERIMVSDGISPPVPYLVPPVVGESYGRLAYAHTHIVWLRGINWKNINSYDAVEVWASPFSSDPARLAPYKVADSPYTSMGGGQYHAGGHGYYAMPESTGEPYDQIALFNLATKEKTVLTMPGHQFAKYHMGITPTHVWMAIGDIGGVAPSIARFTLPAP